MGKRDREHRKKVQARNALLNNPLGRTAVAIASRGRVISELNRASTEDQIHVLDSQVAGKDPSKLASAIKSKAPREMDKAISKFLKEGKPVSVESLTAEIRSTPGFLKMCAGVGIDISWFESLAQERMKANGL